MQINTDTTQTIHDSYDEYELSQLIVSMDIGDQVIIRVNGVILKEYTAKYINCHFNLQFQDKGTKIDVTQLTEAELLQRQIDKLEAEKLQLEATKT